MPFTVSLGPCTACEKSPANFQIGSRTCEKCGATYGRMCAACSVKPCPKCLGKLEATAKVFPHSLFQAIADEDEGAVRRLSSGRREDLDHITDSHGETALSRAARCKSSAVATSLCEILIAAGASPTAKTANHGRTPLILMVMYRGTYYQKVAELLRPSIICKINLAAPRLCTLQRVLDYLHRGRATCRWQGIS